jgi:DNA-binding response OmpR family regulator
MSVTHTIWVVDDEPLIRTAIVAVLEERGDQAVGFGSAGELYTALVDGGEPDLIILDQMLPDESGSLVVRSLREREEYRDIPVLFLTAVSDVEADRLADLAPVLGKPFDFRDLIRMVDQLVSSEDADEALAGDPAS